MYFSNSIISWFYKNARDLPWRKTNNPYKIWISEIILQQTRVNQGLPYYLKFIEKYPTIDMLARASEDEVMKLWQGLGYYSRARNMHYTSKYIVNNLQSKFPSTYEEIIKLLKKYETQKIFLDLPINRTKPPNNKYSFNDLVNILNHQ